MATATTLPGAAQNSNSTAIPLVRLTVENWRPPLQEVVATCQKQCDDLREMAPGDEWAEGFCETSPPKAVAVQKQLVEAIASDDPVVEAARLDANRRLYVEELAVARSNCYQYSAGVRRHLLTQQQQQQEIPTGATVATDIPSESGESDALRVSAVLLLAVALALGIGFVAYGLRRQRVRQ